MATDYSTRMYVPKMKPNIYITEYEYSRYNNIYINVSLTTEQQSTRVLYFIYQLFDYNGLYSICVLIEYK